MSQTDDLTANLYGVDEVLSAMQKSIRRGLDKETLFWTAELEQSGLGLLALARFGIIIPEDIGLGGPELAVDYCAVRKAYLSLLQSCDAALVRGAPSQVLAAALQLFGSGSVYRGGLRAQCGVAARRGPLSALP